jgi:hypothetical protein
MSAAAQPPSEQPWLPAEQPWLVRPGPSIAYHAAVRDEGDRNEA